MTQKVRLFPTFCMFFVACLKTLADKQTLPFKENMPGKLTDRKYVSREMTKKTSHFGGVV